MKRRSIGMVASYGLCVGLVLAGVLTIACTNGSGATGKRPADVPLPQRHAIHSDQLKAVMGNLGSTVASHWPQEIEADMREGHEREYREAAYLAGQLAETARVLPQVVPAESMTPSDRDAFMANVTILDRQASQLEAAARDRQLQEMRDVLFQIQSTCYGCHSQFRDQPGPLKFGT